MSRHDVAGPLKDGNEGVTQGWVISSRLYERETYSKLTCFWQHSVS